MLSLSKIHTEVARIKNANVRFPKTDKEIYWQYYFRLEFYFQELIDDIYTQTSSLEFPLTMKPIEEYLSGYTIRYLPFDKIAYGKPELEGFWDCDPAIPFEIYVLYNTSGASTKRQRFTQVHETMHILQYLDPEFREFIDDFLKYKTLPFDMVVKLVESTTDQATAMYLVPKKELIAQYEQVNDLEKLSDYFQVSHESIFYRLKNTGVLVPI